jgi:hypothetical protein
MKLYRFGPDVGRQITQFESDFVMTPLVRLAQGAAQIGCMHLGPGGVVGFHPATVPQLFLVVAGAGWVRGPEAERTPIRPYEAAFWPAGEWHESGSDAGMTAIVIEGEGVDPTRLMSEV